MRKGIFGLILIILLAGCIGQNTNNSSNSVTMPQRNLSGGFSGTVIDKEGNPIENVSIYLVGNGTRFDASSDAEGNFTFAPVTEGIYSVAVSKPGFISQNLTGFAILGGHIRTWRFFLVSSYGGFHGKIISSGDAPLQDAEIILTGDSENYSGMTDGTGAFDIQLIAPGSYHGLAQKIGYKNVSIPAFTVLAGRSYAWNATLKKDCIYYPVDTTTDYALRYGFSGTMYHGQAHFFIAYPQGAEYEFAPADDNRLSQISTIFLAGNRVLDWHIDNSKGDYSFVQGHAYINMTGKNSMHLFENQKMSIDNAGKAQPGYLGSETNKNGERLIDPMDRDIARIARQVKVDAMSNDTWTVAESLFLWLKNNTAYYIDLEAYNYSRLPAETLRSGKGKCDELSQLYISMLRADGIPARFVKGYMVEKDPGQYIGHRWVEFYDGEWVPVEVSGNSGNMDQEAAMRFGVQQPDHVQTFLDDGTDEAIDGADNFVGSYSGTAPDFSFKVFYDAAGSDRMYIASCADGTRELVEDKG